jgi:hypothetical protein
MTPAPLSQIDDPIDEPAEAAPVIARSNPIATAPNRERERALRDMFSPRVSSLEDSSQQPGCAFMRRARLCTAAQVPAGAPITQAPFQAECG